MWGRGLRLIQRDGRITGRLPGCEAAGQNDNRLKPFGL